jgi:hypothetical protein
MINLFKKVWVVKATTTSAMHDKVRVEIKSLSPMYYWEAKKSAEHLTAFYSCPGYFDRTYYTVEKWNPELHDATVYSGK